MQKKNTMTASPAKGRKKFRFNKSHLVLTILVAPAVILLFFFHYLPLPGVAIAFAKYNLGGFQKWVGLENFQYIFNLNNFWRAFGNNWLYVGLNYLFSFPSAIILAILFNEVRIHYYKNFVQTISTLPHFLSWAVVAGVWTLLLSPSSGYVNELVKFFGGDPIYFLGDNNTFPYIYTAISIWKGVGYSSIIYLAALSGIDTQLYEAASMDGAGRWKQTIHITLPGLKPTILVMLVLSFASVLNLFEPLYVFRNPLINNSTSVLDIYVFETGITQGRYDMATAMGLFKSTISLFLVLGSNFLSKKFTEDGSSIL